MFLAAIVAVSCTGNVDDGPETLEGELVLTADKENIYTNGTDAVTFTVKHDGKDVTKKVKFLNLNNYVYLASGTITYSSLTTGTVDFRAEYKNLKSNIITVEVRDAMRLETSQTHLFPNNTDKAVLKVFYMDEDVTANATVRNETTQQNLTLTGGQYEYKLAGNYNTDFTATYQSLTSAAITISPKVFYKMCGLFRFTATWCGYCTNFANSLKLAEAEYPNRLVSAAVHCDDIYQYSKFFEMMTTLEMTSGTGYSIPKSSFDFRTTISGAQATSTILGVMKTCVENYPATTGFEVTSAVEGSSVVVTIDMEVSAEGEYGLCVCLLEDDIAGSQSGVSGTYYHNNTLRYMTSDLYGESLGTVSAYGKVTKTYTIPLASNYVRNNCRLMVYSTYKSGGKTYINNSCYAKIEGTTPYSYEIFE